VIQDVVGLIRHPGQVQVTEIDIALQGRDSRDLLLVTATGILNFNVKRHHIPLPTKGRIAVEGRKKNMEEAVISDNKV
jgi:hypothetical protein